MGYRPRDRVSAVELALELLTAGTVCGLPADHRPVELEELLGPPVGEGILSFSGNLLRDYGLLEAYYDRPDPSAPWRGMLFMGQMHRMPKPLKWRLIARELREREFEVSPVPMPKLDDRYFRVEASGSQVIVNAGTAPAGHISKISAPDWLNLDLDRAEMPLSLEQAQALPSSWRDMKPRDVADCKLARAIVRAGLVDDLDTWNEVLRKLP